MRPKLRQDDAILAAAAKIAITRGYQRVTRKEVADAIGMSPATINQRWGTMAQFRRDVMRYAIRASPPVLAVIAQGLAMRDPYARKAPKILLQQAKEIL